MLSCVNCSIFGNNHTVVDAAALPALFSELRDGLVANVQFKLKSAAFAQSIENTTLRNVYVISEAANFGLAQIIQRSAFENVRIDAKTELCANFTGSIFFNSSIIVHSGQNVLRNLQNSSLKSTSINARSNGTKIFQSLENVNISQMVAIPANDTEFTALASGIVLLEDVFFKHKLSFPDSVKQTNVGNDLLVFLSALNREKHTGYFSRVVIDINVAAVQGQMAIESFGSTQFEFNTCAVTDLKINDICIRDSCSLLSGSPSCSNHSCDFTNNVFNCVCTDNMDPQTGCSTCRAGYIQVQSQCFELVPNPHGTCYLQNGKQICKCSDRYFGTTCTVAGVMYGVTCAGALLLLLLAIAVIAVAVDKRAKKQSKIVRDMDGIFI